MHPINLIYNSLDKNDSLYPQLPEKAVIRQAVCAITGEKSDCIARRHVLGSNFTDIARLKDPTSGFVSVAAYVALKYKWERYSSWFCDGNEFIRLDKPLIRKFIFDTDKRTELKTKTWCAYVTTSYKKHGAIKAVVNSGMQNVWTFEDILVDCRDEKKNRETWNNLLQMLLAGVSRKSLETLELRSNEILKINIKSWMRFLKWGSQHYKSNLYKFMIYLLPSQKEIKEGFKVYNGI